MIKFFRQCMGGVSAVLTISSTPLYRFPYRNSMEAMVGDWRRIGKDISAVMEKLDEREQQE